MVTMNMKDNKMKITPHNKCENITNLSDSFTQVTAARTLQHNNKVAILSEFPC